jgi:hypothetical protein
MCMPGFGDSNGTDMISELRLAGWSGSIDIEGWSSAVYRDALEMTCKIYALHHLKPGMRFCCRPGLSDLSCRRAGEEA